MPTTKKWPTLDAGNHLNIKHVVPGAVIYVRWDGSWPASRPTARTDVTVWSQAPTGTAEPPWLLVNDRFYIRDGSSSAPYSDTYSDTY